MRIPSLERNRSVQRSTVLPESLFHCFLPSILLLLTVAFGIAWHPRPSFSSCPTCYYPPGYDLRFHCNSNPPIGWYPALGDSLNLQWCYYPSADYETRLYMDTDYTVTEDDTLVYTRSGYPSEPPSVWTVCHLDSAKTYWFKVFEYDVSDPENPVFVDSSDTFGYKTSNKLKADQALNFEWSDRDPTQIDDNVTHWDCEDCEWSSYDVAPDGLTVTTDGRDEGEIMKYSLTDPVRWGEEWWGENYDDSLTDVFPVRYIKVWIYGWKEQSDGYLKVKLAWPTSESTNWSNFSLAQGSGSAVWGDSTFTKPGTEGGWQQNDLDDLEIWFESVDLNSHSDEIAIDAVYVELVEEYPGHLRPNELANDVWDENDPDYINDPLDPSNCAILDFYNPGTNYDTAHDDEGGLSLYQVWDLSDPDDLVGEGESWTTYAYRIHLFVRGHFALEGDESDIEGFLGDVDDVKFHLRWDEPPDIGFANSASKQAAFDCDNHWYRFECTHPTESYWTPEELEDLKVYIKAPANIEEMAEDWDVSAELHIDDVYAELRWQKLRSSRRSASRQRLVLKPFALFREKSDAIANARKPSDEQACSSEGSSPF